MSEAAEGESERPANPFSSMAIAALLAIGIGAFCVYLVLSAYAPDTRSDRRGGSSALSVSAIGFAGLVELLRSRDIPVAISRVSNGTATPAFLVLTPPATGKPVPWTRLADPDGTVLMVLPKWDTVPDPEHPGWIERAGLVNLRTAAALLPASADLSRRSGRQSAVVHGSGEDPAIAGTLQLASIDRLQTMGISTEWTPILLDEAGKVVLARWTEAEAPDFVVLTDPDLLDTQGLKDIAGARAALTIVDALREGAPVTFDVALNGLGISRNLLQLLFEPPLLGATLCAAASALLMLVMALHRFGPPARTDRVLDFGKRALADNSSALIAMARRETHMAVPYVQLARALVIREIGAPARLQQPAIDAFLDAASSARGLPDAYTELEKAAAAVTDKAALMNLAGRLHQWSQGMRRGRR